MPTDDKNLIRVIKSLDYLKDTLTKYGLPTDAEILRSFVSETTFMLNILQLWAGRAEDPNCTAPPLVNWLENYEVDLTSKNPASRPFWLGWEEAYLQSQLLPGQKFQQITFTETSPGSGVYAVVAYLCPPATKIIRGGPNGSFDPAQPPHSP